MPYSMVKEIYTHRLQQNLVFPQPLPIPVFENNSTVLCIWRVLLEAAMGKCNTSGALKCSNWRQSTLPFYSA